MHLLLDTHAFLWWLDGSRQLSRPARDAITDESNLVSLSAASAWELATKARLGKLPGALSVAANVEGVVETQGFRPLPITIRQAQRAGALPGPHRDPFDRMLISQALELDLVLVSNERPFDFYGVQRFW